ncbi:unnamed protein product [Acanthoscelides obtectus]|uniref:Reverse transcriptase domain-containing protein n=1 Tax=Acanthoscelides obtectus TaxID=200917 RepID=A0A9P0PPJ6_ACAOB|nr:unnamed protein product [Acanthoscelides obtectus]CAK1671060.1 hypothetical protein AOBTE_LOCUS28026 [Acanthoscelides obtectus]
MNLLLLRETNLKECVGIRGTPLNLSRYLSNRKQCVKIQDTTIDFRVVEYGVLQGTVLEPILFNIYMNDWFLNETNDGVLDCADDTVIRNCITSLAQRKDWAYAAISIVVTRLSSEGTLVVLASIVAARLAGAELNPLLPHFLSLIYNVWWKQYARSRPAHHYGSSSFGKAAYLFRDILAESVEGIVGECQTGFTCGRSAIDQVFVLREIQAESYEHMKPTFALFVEFKQAYDMAETGAVWGRGRVSEYDELSWRKIELSFIYFKDIISQYDLHTVDIKSVKGAYVFIISFW